MYKYTSPSQAETEGSGVELFRNFVNEELEHEGLTQSRLEEEICEAQGLFVNQSIQSSFSAGYKNDDLVKAGVKLRELADKFAKSQERKEIRKLADEVDLGHSDRDDFIWMCLEVLRDGIDKTRLIALFFFFSDVLKRCVKEKLNNLYEKVFTWSVEFVKRRVCKWVHEHGGWVEVLKTYWFPIKEVIVGISTVVGIACGVIYLYNNLFVNLYGAFVNIAPDKLTN